MYVTTLFMWKANERESPKCLQLIPEIFPSFVLLHYSYTETLKRNGSKVIEEISVVQTRSDIETIKRNAKRISSENKIAIHLFVCNENNYYHYVW